MLGPLFLLSLVMLVAPPIVGSFSAPPTDLTTFVLASAGFFPTLSRWALVPITGLAALWCLLAAGVLIGRRSRTVRTRWLAFYGIIAVAGLAVVLWAVLAVAVPMLTWT